MVKEKQIRTYDQDGFRRRAACICVHDPDESEIMLVTSTRAPEYWIVPGGGVEPNEDPTQAAIRETEEEAGVKGVVKRSLGDIEVCCDGEEENTQRKHRTSVFVLEVHEELDDYEDSKMRKRCWFPVLEAFKLLSIYKPVQCSYVQLMIQTSSSPKLLSLLSSITELSQTLLSNGPSISSTASSSTSSLHSPSSMKIVKIKTNETISTRKNHDCQSHNSSNNNNNNENEENNENEQTKFIFRSSTIDSE